MQQLQTLHYYIHNNYDFQPNQIKHLIESLLKKENQDQKICPHNLQITNLEKMNFQLLNQVQCDCQIQIHQGNHEIKIILILLYILEQNSPENINLTQFLDFSSNFRFYRIFKRNNNQDLQIVNNLRNLLQFAKQTGYQNCLSYQILELGQYYLKVVNIFDGIFDGQRMGLTFGQIENDYFRLLQFFSIAENEKLVLVPICIHTINLGSTYKFEGKNHQVLQSIQERCEACDINHLCSSFGIFGLSLQQLEQTTQNFDFLLLLQEVAQGNITPLSFVNQLLNSKYVDNVQEFQIQNFSLFQTGNTLNTLNIRNLIEFQKQIYKIYFIKNTLGEMMEFFLKNVINFQNLIVEIYQIFQLFLNKLIRDLRNILQPQFEYLWNGHQLSQIELQNQQELTLFNDGFNNQQFQQYKLYPNMINEFNINNYYQIILNNNYGSVKLNYRVRCCLIINDYFAHENILRNLKPYLEATNFQNGYQFSYFDKYIENTENQNIVQQLLDTLNLNYENILGPHQN